MIPRIGYCSKMRTTKNELWKEKIKKYEKL